MLAVVVLIGAGVWHPVHSLTDVALHPVTLSVAGALGPVAIGAVALAGVSAAYATSGGNQAIAFGEEAGRAAPPHGRMILVIASRRPSMIDVGSVGIGTATAGTSGV